MDSIHKSCDLYEIIIIDNSTKNLLSKNYKNCQIIKPGKMLGYGKAVNIGFEYALQRNAENIIVLNQDALISNEDIKYLFSNLEFLDDRSILLPIVKSIEDKCIPEHYISFFTEEGYSKDDLFQKDRLLEIRKNEIGFPGFAIKADFLYKIGGFDPIFFMYCEDIDLILRIKDAGGKIFFLSNCFIKHRKSIFSFSSSLKTKQRNMWNQHSKFILSLKYENAKNDNISILKSFNKFFNLKKVRNIKGNTYQIYLLIKNINHIKRCLGNTIFQFQKN